MSENIRIKDFRYYIDWLNNSITEEHIRYYEYSNFTNIQEIGRGSYGNVVRAYCKNYDRFFALKSFNNDEQTIKEVVKESNSNNNNKETIEINDDLIDNESLNIYEYESLKHHSLDEENKSNSNNKGTNDDLNDDDKCGNGLQDYSSDMNEFENNSSSTSNKTTSESSMNAHIYKNQLLLKLDADGFITPDKKVKELLKKKFTEPKFLYALKLLFENFQNEFSSQVLIDSLKALADPTSYDHYSKENIVRLELHLRTLIAVLEQICFSPTVLSKELQDKVYSSLTKFMEIHQKTIQVIRRVNNNFQKNDNVKNDINKCNYNIDFLLIHLRDTLYSLRDDKTWFQELLRRVKNMLSAILNITPSRVIDQNNNYSILSMFTQLHQDLNFKSSVTSYYTNWRIMLIIQHNIFNWYENEKEVINKKFGEMILMEYFWSYLEEECIKTADKFMLDSQTKINEMSNKLSKSLNNTGRFLNDLIRNESLELPNTLWFGILDLAQNLIQKSTQTATYGLCYYMAIESLNKAPNSFIQFKAIEILLHLYNINNELFSMIELDFDQYSKKLNENNLTNSSEKVEEFNNLIIFIKEKCNEDFKIISNKIGKEKGKGKDIDQNIYLKEEQILSPNILDFIADKMICPISNEPSDQLCILKCQHVISLNNLKKLKHKECPQCREKIENDNIRYLPQNSIYKKLYPYLLKAGYILPPIEFENSDQITNNKHDSDSENSEADLILAKKKKSTKEMKLNPNRSLRSIFQIRKKHPVYQNIIKELEERHHEEAMLRCQEYLENFPYSYTMRCILAYTYRNLNNYKQAHSYLKEAIERRKENPIAYYLRGELYFRRNVYYIAITYLKTSITYKLKINNVFIMLGNSYLLEAEKHKNNINYYNCNHKDALKNYIIVLQTNPNDYSCLKNCAYIYEIQKHYSDALRMLEKLLNINQNDSLILCYYGEILNNLGRYNESLIYFTKAFNIDPKNIHILIKQAITHYILQEYNKTLLYLNEIIQIDPLNSIAYYYIGLTYFMMDNFSNAVAPFERCMELNPDNSLARMHLYYLKCLQDNNHKGLENINIFNNKFRMLFMRCKIYIKLEKYSQALWDLCSLFNSYEAMGVYLISNLINLDDRFNHFLISDSNSLSGNVLSFGNEVLPTINLPKFYIDSFPNNTDINIIWKINVKKILSKHCFVKFIVTKGHSIKVKRHVLNYDDVSKLEGLGWIEYTLPFRLSKYDFSDWIQPSIEIKNRSIILQIDYVRFFITTRKRKTITFPNIEHFLPLHPNVPEAFKEKYFSRKEMENLIKLDDIINN
ncbi:hypothetical protein C1645_806542 [Glomus cerebriforme]|uniref:Uncharacterized protein n=1 Tax=Glomus cerebriforme TaxID=658196 RepID=A0A397SS30_9GLOM|nr:hypothetical protein C1645_806542 [Glomus cerebriforme]